MSEQVVQPTENRRQCLIWTGILCAIAYAIFFVLYISSINIYPTKIYFAGLSNSFCYSNTFDSTRGVFFLFEWFRIVGILLFIGGMIALVCDNGKRISSYVGLVGACIFFVFMFCRLCVLAEEDSYSSEVWEYNILVSIYELLLLPPVVILRNRVPRLVRHIGMFGVFANIVLLRFRCYPLHCFSDTPVAFVNYVLFCVFYVFVLICWKKTSVQLGADENSKWLEGRSCRREYWTTILVLIFITVVESFLVYNFYRDSLIAHLQDNREVIIRKLSYGKVLLDSWIMLVSLVTIPLSVRRLHDNGLSGWWLLPFIIFTAIPLVGWIVPIIQYIFVGCLEGTVGPNKYGPDPKVTERERLLAMLAVSSNSAPTPVPAPTSMPTLTPTITEAQSTIEERLTNLQELKDKGLITETGYQTRREKILSEL